MATEFITALVPGAQEPKTQTLSQVRDRIHKFIRDGEKARLREEGQEYGNWRKEGDIVPRIIDRLEKMGVGPKLIVQRERDHEGLAIREVTTSPDLGAAPAIEAIHGAVWAKFTCRSGGLWLCRYIDGTRTVSRHGYQSSSWKGAAEDIFPNEGGAQGLENIANFVIGQTKSGNLNARTVIWLQRIWEAGVGERVYGGQTHYHVHVDVAGGSACNP